MKTEFYAVDFYATETLQNGRERETVQTVYFSVRDSFGRYSKWSPFSCVEAAENELIEQHYYNLLFKGSRRVKMSVVLQ